MTSPDNPQQLAEEIERTREQLGVTVEALAAKADVRARAQDKVNQVGTRLKGTASQAGQQIRRPVPMAVSAGKQISRPAPLAVSASAVGAGLVTFLLIRSRRR